MLGILRKRFVRPILLVTCFMFLTGCESMRARIADAYIVDSATTRSGDPTDGGVAPKAFNLDTDLFPGGYPCGASDGTKALPAYECAIRATGTEQKFLRDRLQSIILNRSDEICRSHQGRILSNAATFDFGTGFISTVLSTASAAVGGEVAKTVLSAGSATSSAAGTGVRASFYQDIVASAVVNEINRLRQEVAEHIAERRKESSTTYTVDDAIRDANLYHFRCSFYEGLVSLTKEKVVKPRAKQDIANEIEARLKQNDSLVAEQKKSIGDDAKRLLQGAIEANATEIRRLIFLMTDAPGTLTIVK